MFLKGEGAIDNVDATEILGIHVFFFFLYEL